MRIAMVAHHGCIRVWKQAQMLMNEGHEVAVISQRMHDAEIERYETFMHYEDASQLRRSVEILDRAGFEIFQCHNEPDWLVTITRRATKKPVIFDIHDLESVRLSSAVTFEELELFRTVDGIIHVSEGMQKFAQKLHRHTVPDEVIFTYTPEALALPAEDLATYDRIPNSIVYEGGITEAFSTPRTGETPDGRKQIEYKSFRDFGPIFKKLVQAGLEVHIHPCITDENILKGYRIIGCHVHKPLPIGNLIGEMTKYQYTFVGSSSPMPLLDLCMPNKLFEPMHGSGCIPLVFNAKEAERFVLSNSLGLSFPDESIGAIKSKIATCDTTAYRTRILETRPNFLMEAQYEKLMDLYDRAIYHNKTKEE